MKLKYIPGLRPTPMLMYQTEKNEQEFRAFLREMNVRHHSHFHHHGEHYWNMNAYIIVDHDKVIAMAFCEFIYVIYLLRVVNKELIIEVPDDYLALMEKDLNQLKGEIEIIK